LELSSDSENTLLSRREVRGTFTGGSGLITRQSACDAIASKLGVDKSKVQVISLRGKFGTRDLITEAYVFNDTSKVKEQLPHYITIRQLPKDERKKAREEQKKAKASTAPAAGSEPAKK